MAKSWTEWNMSATNNSEAKPDHVRYGSAADVATLDQLVRLVPGTDINSLASNLGASVTSDQYNPLCPTLDNHV